jgi:carbamoyl-phosphate synthase large subunit
MGESLQSMSHLWQHTDSEYVAVKSVTIPFSRFHGANVILGPEMRSTGEVMGVARDFATAYAKAQNGIGMKIPTDGGTVLVSASDKCFALAEDIMATYRNLGFKTILSHWYSDSEMLDFSGAEMLEAEKLSELALTQELQASNVRLAISVGELGEPAPIDQKLRRTCIKSRIPLLLTAESAFALASSIQALRKHGETVVSIQELHHAMIELAGASSSTDFIPLMQNRGSASVVEF